MNNLVRADDDDRVTVNGKTTLDGVVDDEVNNDGMVIESLWSALQWMEQVLNEAI